MKLTQKILTAAILMTGLAHQAGAQKTITFESRTTYSKSKPGSKRHKQENCKNSVTIGLASPLNGYLPVYYERKVGSNMSIQAGAGLSFRSLGYDAVEMVRNDGEKSDRFDNSNSTFVDMDDSYENYSYRNAKPGYYLSISPRFYFSSEDCMNSFFVGPLLEYKHFRYSSQLANTSAIYDPYSSSGGPMDYPDDRVARTSEAVNEFRDCLDLTLNLGRHLQTRGGVAFSLNVGLGVRKFSEKRLDVGTEISGGQQYFLNAVRQYDGIRPLVLFNMTLGGCF
jgi:hypothetical protein